MDIEIAKTVLKPDSDKRLGNIIKTRDDRDLVVFNQIGNLVELTEVDIGYQTNLSTKSLR